MDLNTVQEIERAIEALPPAQREELSAWFEERYSEAVDARLKADIDAGRFDDRIDRAIAEHKAGRTEPL
jgi:DNA-directed RNA polymerase specialized sigma24 family protein